MSQLTDSRSYTVERSIDFESAAHFRPMSESERYCLDSCGNLGCHEIACAFEALEERDILSHIQIVHNNEKEVILLMVHPA